MLTSTTAEPAPGARASAPWGMLAAIDRQAIAVAHFGGTPTVTVLER